MKLPKMRYCYVIQNVFFNVNTKKEGRKKGNEENGGRGRRWRKKKKTYWSFHNSTECMLKCTGGARRSFINMVSIYFLLFSLSVVTVVGLLIVILHKSYFDS